MQFYKKRDFGALIGDTFSFFRIYGVNFTKNYLMLMMPLLMMFLVVFIIGFKDLFLAGSFMQTTYGDQYVSTYFSENSTLLFICGVFSVFILLFLWVINYSFPVIYIKKISESGAEKLTLEEIIQEYKKVSRKLIIFFVGYIFVVIPIFMVVFFVNFLLMFVVIGFILIIPMIIGFLSISNFALYDFLYRQEGFLTAIKNSFSILFSDFLKYIGSTFVMGFIVNMISFMLSFLFAFVIGSGAFLVGSSNSEPSMLMLGVIFIIYLVMITVSIVVSNMIYVNTGFMYLDSRKDLHREMDITEIDSIGKE